MVERFKIRIETVLEKCRECKKPFLRYKKTRRGKRTYGDIRKHNAVTCSKICSRIYNRGRGR